MSSLKKVIFEKVNQLYNEDKKYADDIERCEKILRETENRLAWLKEERNKNKIAVKEACETYGFVIGGYKSYSILNNKSDLFFDAETAEKASKKTKEEWEACLMLGRSNSIAAALLRGDYKRVL